MIYRIMNWMGDVKLDYFMFHLYMSVFFCYPKLPWCIRVCIIFIYSVTYYRKNFSCKRDSEKKKRFRQDIFSIRHVQGNFTRKVMDTIM